MSSPQSSAKSRLRSSLRRARLALGPEERREQSDALRGVVLDHLRATPRGGGRGDEDDDAGRPIVAAFLGAAPEPETLELLEELHGLGFRVVLPVCEPDHRLAWASWTPGVALERSAYAPVDEPTGPRQTFAALSPVALLLVPALGMDRAGHRVGQGGGYYDRFLAQHPRDAADAVPRFGMVYRSELLPAGAVPTDPWDQPLDGVFTPDGPVRTRSDPGREQHGMTPRPDAAV